MLALFIFLEQQVHMGLIPHLILICSRDLLKYYTWTIQEYSLFKRFLHQLTKHDMKFQFDGLDIGYVIGMTNLIPKKKPLKNKNKPSEFLFQLFRKINPNK